VATTFRVFGGAKVGSWGFKCLGSQIDLFMGSLEISERKKIKIDPTSMSTVDPIIGMNLSLSQMKLVQSWGLGHFGHTYKFQNNSKN
jgi:hypothetical protein